MYLPASITIEASFLKVLQIGITDNFSLCSFEHCKKGIPLKVHSSEHTGTVFSAINHQSHQPSSSIWCFSSELHFYDIEGISSSVTLSPILVDLAHVSVIRAVDGQDTGLSAQPAEENRLQTGTD